MTMMNKSAIELYDKLMQFASAEPAIEPGSDVYQMSGGNYDDAYEGGIDDGYIMLAKQLLSEFFGVEN